MNAYKPGSKPEEFIDADGLEIIRQHLLITPDQLEEDYNQHLFTGYLPWTTRYGVSISTIDEALKFLSFHEGLHSGYIFSMKRMVKV